MEIVPNTYKELLARAVNGETAVLLPTNAKVGIGRYVSGVLSNPPASATDLETVVRSGLSLVVSRVGRLVKVGFSVAPNGTPQNITEAGIFTAAGIPMWLATFRPRQLPASGASLQFDFTFSME